MNAPHKPSERRLHRRIPLGVDASVQPAHGQPFPASCVELSVGGMTLRSRYVPGEGEVLEVRVSSPQGRVSRPPLHARVQVRRCHACGDGLYELGVEILQVLG